MEDPKLAIILFDYYASDSDVYTLEEKYNEIVQNIKLRCQNNMDNPIFQKLCKPNAYINQVLVANRYNYYLNLQLGKVDNSNDILFINAHDYKGDIMLNFLKKKMIVTISKSPVTSKLLNDQNEYNGENDDFVNLLHLFANISYDGSLKSQKKLANALVSRDQINAKAQYMNEIDLYGNIKNQVSFLSVIDFRVNFVGKDLNCQNVLLYSCLIENQEFGIKNDFIIVDESTHTYIARQKELFKASQYCPYLVDYTDGKIRVSYMSSGWIILRNKNQIYEISYGLAYKLCLLTYVDEIEIYNGGVSITNVQPLNITILYEINVWIPNLQEEKKKVKITYIGWSNEKPKVDVIYDSNSIDIESRDGNDDYDDGNETDEKTEIIFISVCVAIGVIGVIVIAVVVVHCVKKKKKSVNNESTEGEEEGKS